MVTTFPKGRVTMEELQGKVRRVRISSQRQISIPKEFYDALNLEDEAIVEFRGKELIIRPAEQEVVDFSTDILQDLVAQGFAGEELVKEFTRLKTNIPKALERMKEEALEQRAFTGSLDDALDSFLDEGDYE